MEESQPTPTSPERKAKSRNTLILTLAILSFAGFPGGIIAVFLFVYFDLESALLLPLLAAFLAPILGRYAWLMANSELQSIRDGVFPASAFRVTNLGRTLAIFGTFGSPLVLLLWVGLNVLVSSPGPVQSRDSIISDLNSLFADAYQYRLHPSSTGGAQGSYLGYSIPDRSFRNKYGIYSALVVHPDTILFHAKWTQDTTSTISVKLGPAGRPESWIYSGYFE